MIARAAKRSAPVAALRPARAATRPTELRVASAARPTELRAASVAPPTVVAGAPHAPRHTASALEERVTARKREIIVEVLEHKKSLRLGAPDALRHLEGRLAHLRILLADVVVLGWANLGEERRAELDLWVAQ